MKLFTTDGFPVDLPEAHRFPMQKYPLLRARLAASPGFAAADFRVPEPARREELCRAHDPAYVDRVLEGRLTAAEVRAIGFPWSDSLVERSLRSAGATLAAARQAAVDGCSASLAGGTHHASRDAGAGFCVFNDAAITARALQAESLAERVLVIDCDVHQGDGTARIFAGDDSVFTFSIHAAKNFPFRKATSDLDIELPDGTEDAEYLARLADGIDRAFAAARADFVLYLAGADPYADDRLGRLALSIDGLAQRDRLVIGRCREHGLPLAIAMAGGYARCIDDTARIHAATITLARDLYFGPLTT